MPGSTKKNRRRLTLAAFAVWSVTLGASSLPAAVLPYTLPLLAQKSRHIIVGEVVALECYRAPFPRPGRCHFPPTWSSAWNAP
jgi:hypothetical protein